MGLGYTVRASRSMVLHPLQGVERVRGRMDRRQDKRQLEALRVPASDLYGAVRTGLRACTRHSSCHGRARPQASFDQVWDSIVADLTGAGVRVGMFSYGGWNDSDRAFAEAIWCIVAHVRPARVVETGVAHGLTSRVILEGLDRNGSGHLWSVDLPAVDSALHPEIGMAVPDGLRSRWTYVQGTGRERLPHLLAELGRSTCSSTTACTPDVISCLSSSRHGPPCDLARVAVVDDIDHSLAFRTFVDEASREDGGRRRVRAASRGAGLWGVAIKAGSQRDRRRTRLAPGYTANVGRSTTSGDAGSEHHAPSRRIHSTKPSPNS